MFKIFTPILIIMAVFRNSSPESWETSGVKASVASETVVQAPLWTTAVSSLEQMSISGLAESGSPASQPALPSSVAWTRIKGGWIDIEQLMSR